MTVEPIYKSIGKVIRGKRRGREWSQDDLASRLGISRATLANIETGRQRILAHQLYAFAEVFETMPAEFLPPASADTAQLAFSSFQSGNLEPQQKQQIARLIGQVQTAPRAREKSDGSPTPRVARNKG